MILQTVKKVTKTVFAVPVIAGVGIAVFLAGPFFYLICKLDDLDYKDADPEPQMDAHTLIAEYNDLMKGTTRPLNQTEEAFCYRLLTELMNEKLGIVHAYELDQYGKATLVE